ncbi:MAG: LysM peptidoglycan-binding domain-containing protein [Lactobacillaceae bacterium]|jgi:LysM repeat protein|nr:LysM peptidoglycan-binding domain-containing protein [Lactobacillaceae bacterium]
MTKNANKQLYKSGKFWVAAAATFVGAVVPMANQDHASADEAGHSSWRAKTIDEVKSVYAASGTTGSYTVEAGDTLSSISGATGISVEDLAAKNNLADSNFLLVGQQLSISNQATTAAPEATPEVTTPTGLAADGLTYTVQAGDSLSKIAEYTGVTVSNLVGYNGLGSDETLILVGQVLQLQAPQVEAPAPAAEPESSAAPEVQAPASTAPVEAAAPAAAVETPAVAPQPEAPATPAAPVATGDYAEALNALNALRAQHGLAPLTLDAGLGGTAQMRANMMAGSVDAAHWAQTYGHEVVAIQWGQGAGVINAWYVDDASVGMVGGPAHRNWELNASYTRVGFGYDAATGTFVAEAA